MYGEYIWFWSTQCMFAYLYKDCFLMQASTAALSINNSHAPDLAKDGSFRPRTIVDSTHWPHNSCTKARAGQKDLKACTQHTQFTSASRFRSLYAAHASASRFRSLYAAYASASRFRSLYAAYASTSRFRSLYAAYASASRFISLYAAYASASRFKSLYAAYASASRLRSLYAAYASASRFKSLYAAYASASRLRSLYAAHASAISVPAVSSSDWAGHWRSSKQETRTYCP